jgi:hypothetical protein
MRVDRRAVLALLTLAGLSAGSWCHAELPPLSPQEQRDRAEVVVAGTVKSVKRLPSKSTRPGFKDNVVEARVAVSKVLKGPGVRPGKEIQVRYWQAAERPARWAGPGGQHGDLKRGARVTLFLRREADKRLHLLNPNGWEPIR